MEEATFEREPGTARESQDYVKKALSALMPVVLETLLKQDEDSADDLEHWDLGESSAMMEVLMCQGALACPGLRSKMYIISQMWYSSVGRGKDYICLYDN